MKRKKKQKKMVRSWLPPHVDGNNFLQEYIGMLCSDVDKQGAFRDDVFYAFPEDDLNIEMEDDAYDAIIDNLGPWYEPEYVHLWVDDYLNNTGDGVDRTFIQFKDIQKRMSDCLEAREVNELLECIYELLDIRGMLGNEDFWESGVIEAWTRVLDIELGSSKEEGENESLIKQVELVVHEMCVGLCNLIARNPRILQNVEWRQLEQVVAVSIEGLGFKIELTPSAKDGGKDIIATCVLEGQTKTFYIEIKHWRSGKHVGDKNIFNFIELNVLERTDGGLFLSSSGYTWKVYSQLAEINARRVHLGSEDKIVFMCQQFVRRQQGIWKPKQALPEILFERTIKRAN